MRRVWNSKLAAPLIILGLLIVLIFALMLRWHDAPNAAHGETSTPGANDRQVTESKEPKSIVEPQLPAWERPATTCGMQPMNDRSLGPLTPKADRVYPSPGIFRSPSMPCT